MKKKKFNFGLSTTQIIMLSFLFAIFIGSVLLVLPVSTQSGESVSYIDALFTATTATCVTGLVTLPTVSTWSFFGQAVILILIQIGGLGIITVMSGLMIAVHRKMRIKDNMLIQDAFNLNSLSGLARFVKKVLIGTFIIESIGALLYMTVFVPEFGARGIWISVFNSVSAFCNAGIDIISENSLYAYAKNPIINVVTCALVILGGIGYIVWWDVIRVFKDSGGKKRRFWQRLTLHSKIVLSATAVLVFGGALLMLIFEYENPMTIGGYSLFDKIQACLFQSVTTRTAGFSTIPQENLTGSSAILCVLLMFIGGSPVGTAGGIKTTTVVVILATAYTAIRNRNEVSIFHRELPRQITLKAVAVAGMSFVMMFVCSLLLAATTDAPAMDIVYESVSAIATVGLTRGVTPLLDVPGKIIIIFTMYVGRIAPISLAVFFGSKKEVSNIIKNPTENISVG